MALKALKGLGKNISKAVKGQFDTASKELTEAIGKQWGKGATKAGREAGEEVSKEVAQQADHVVKNIDEALTFESSVARKVSDLSDSANKNLTNAIQQAESRLTEKTRQLERMERKIVSWEELRPDAVPRLQELAGKMEQEIVVLEQRAKELSNISDLMTDFNTTGNLNSLETAVTSFRSSNTLGPQTPFMHAWQTNSNNIFKSYSRVQKNVSKNLGNDTAFLKEFMRLKRGQNKGALEYWLSNPQNYAKLEKLKDSKRIANIIDQGHLTIRQRITGVTPQDWARRLGLTTAATAGGAGAIGIYNWFAGNDPDKTATVSNKISGVSGSATDIEKAADESLKRITQIAKKSSAAMKTNPAGAVSFYTENITKELEVLSDALEKWDTVVENSENPSVAEKKGKNISQFANNLAAQISSLAGTVGVNIKDVEQGTATKTQKKDDNILKVQKSLGITPSGVLDEETTRVLRNLEIKYNKMTDDNEFTGAFVVPEIGHVVDYNELIEAYNKVKNYKRQ